MSKGKKEKKQLKEEIRDLRRLVDDLKDLLNRRDCDLITLPPDKQEHPRSSL